MAERTEAEDSRRKTAMARLLAAERGAKAAAEHADHWVEPLRRSAAAAITSTSLDAVLRSSLEATADALDADAAAILIASPKGDELVARAAVGLGEELDLSMRIRAGAGVAGRILASGQPLIVDDLSLVEVVSKALRSSGVRSLVGVPLQSGGRVMGVMHVSSRAVAYFSDDDVEVLAVLSDPIAAAIARVELFESERTARLAAELAAEQLRSLQRITAALASAGGTDEVCDVILRESVIGSGSDAQRGIWMLHGGRLMLVAGDERSRLYPEIPLDSSFPALDNLEEGRPLFVETREEFIARWPVLESVDTAAFAGFPLIADGRTLGLMAIGYTENHPFEETERTYLTSVAEQAALALDRARIRAREDEVRARRDFLAEASIAISEPYNDPARLLRRLAELVVPSLADTCIVMLARGDALDPVAIAPGGALSDEAVRLLRSVPLALEAHGPVASVMRSGVALLIKDAAQAASGQPPYDQIVAELQVTSAMFVALLAHGRAIGVMLFAACGNHEPYGRADLELATDIGSRAAAAAEDIVIRSRERTFTEMLTRALLPSRFPIVPELAFAARYVPADLGPVGGDWYDVFQLPDGRVGLVIGDVAGHGVEAASTMARLRNGLFAYATEGHEATAIFDRLCSLLADPSGDWQIRDPLATVLYAIYDRSSGHIVTACAGHPPWLRLHGDKAEYIPCGGRLLAPGLETMTEEHIVALEHDDTLLFFTDGLVERPGESLETGLDRLADAVAGGGQMDLDAICDLALAATAPAAGRHDDCCLLAVRVL